MSTETKEVKSEQMKFIVYKQKNTSKKELLESDLNLGNQKIPNSKIIMFFFQAEKLKSLSELNTEELNIVGEGINEVEKGNIQVYLDEKRKYIFAETTTISESTHKTLFDEYEIIGELEIPGKKEATEPFVKKMLMKIRAFTPKK